MSWLPGFTKRQKLTIQSANVDSDLTDFPILIKPKSGEFYNEISDTSHRKQIAVGTSDGHFCYVEIEKYALYNTVLWAKIPSISSSSDTDIYLYFGRDAPIGGNGYVDDVNTTIAANVWDSNFVLVDHMQDYGDTSHTVDSTSNNNDAAKKGANEPIEVSAQVGDGESFDGGDDYEEIAASASLNITGVVTVEAFFYTTNVGAAANGAFFDKTIGGATNKQYILFYEAGNLFFRCVTGAAQKNAKELADFSSGWHQGVGVMDGSNVLLYRDGGLVNTGDACAAIDGGAGVSRIGILGGGFYPFNGIIDELRVSNTNRSTAWIKASYYSELDTLLSYGAQQFKRGMPRRRKRRKPEWNMPISEEALRTFRDYLRID